MIGGMYGIATGMMWYELPIFFQQRCKVVHGLGVGTQIRVQYTTHIYIFLFLIHKRKRAIYCT